MAFSHADKGHNGGSLIEMIVSCQFSYSSQVFKLFSTICFGAIQTFVLEAMIAPDIDHRVVDIVQETTIVQVHAVKSLVIGIIFFFFSQRN